MPGRLFGDDRLIAEFRRYALEDGSSEQIVFLGVDVRLIASILAETPAEEVVTLVAGPLQQPLRSFRTGQALSLPDDLGRSAWRSLGYELIGMTGVQGLGSIVSALAERAFRRVGRPDVADRCRIAMLRALVAAWPLSLGTAQVRRYRRMVDASEQGR
jgi:hypothetical protein